MPREVIKAEDARSSPLFSQGVRSGGHIYVSGMTGMVAESGEMAGPTVQEQARQALISCENVLRAAGATLDDVVEVGVLLGRPEDFAGLNEAYSAVFPVPAPARYVAKLGVELPDVLVPIRMTAITS